ncbi:MAG: hypothetical protein AAGH88_10420 [Planctomycetota bacterium]
MRRLSLMILMPLTLLTACGERDDIVVYETTPVAGYDWPNTAKWDDSHEGRVWEVPAGWVATEDFSDLLIADYRFAGQTEDLPGRMTVSVVPGDGGGMQANISRWRDQFFFAVRLNERLRDRLSRELLYDTGFQRLEIVRMQGDFMNRHAPTDMRVAVYTFNDAKGRPFQTWFFKLTGDRETVEKAWPQFIRVIFSFRNQGQEPIDIDALLAEPSVGEDPDPPPLLRRPEGDRP